MDAKLQEPIAVGHDFDPDQRCATSFPLGKIRVGETDKLGHCILDILWCGSDYAVYRSELGVYVHFSDCPERARQQ